MDWTDDRLDALSERMDERSDRVEGAIREIRSGMDEGFQRVNADLRALGAEINGRFDSLQRSLVLLVGGIIAALIGVIGSQL